MTCPTGKLAFSTPEAAREALDRLSTRWAEGTIEFPCYVRRAFLCPDCDNWHLTKAGARHFNPTDVFPSKKFLDIPIRKAHN